VKSRVRHKKDMNNLVAGPYLKNHIGDKSFNSPSMIVYFTF
jgi:hypothetical protein